MTNHTREQKAVQSMILHKSVFLYRLQTRTKKMGQILEKIFKLESHNTTPLKEFVAGFTTFITMAYIIFVNQLMSQAAWTAALLVLV